MGNIIHTPKTIYDNGIIIQFFVKKNIIHYKTLSFGKNDNLTNEQIETATSGDVNDRKPFQVLTGIYENNPDELIKKTRELAPVDAQRLGYAHTYFQNKYPKESQQMFGDVIRQ